MVSLFSCTRQLQNAGVSAQLSAFCGGGAASEKYRAQGLVIISRCAVIGSVFCHSWGHYVTAKSKGRARNFKPIQEGSRSLATDKMTSNHVIFTVALIGLIRLSKYQLAAIIMNHHVSTIYWQIIFNSCHMKRNVWRNYS